MKKILTVVLTLLLVGCASTEPVENVSYPVQTEENVQNTQQTAEPEQNSTESGTVLPDTQDSAENDDLGEPNQVEEDSRERAENTESEVVDAPIVEEIVRTDEGMFAVGCRSFNSGTLSHKYLDRYRAILSDICTDFKMDYSLVEAIASPRVDSESLDLYVDNNVFGLTYWDKYVDGGLEPLTLVVLMEEEQSWWSSQLSGLLTITPEWFGPTDGGGHCYAAEAGAFCPKAYWDYYGETTTGANVLSTMLGSQMDWNTFRKVVPIHEATHQFHTTVGLGHWRWWYVEGQATYFELAATVLVPGLGASSWIDQSLRESASRDRTKFTATTVEGTAAHMAYCDSSGTCDGFRYFAGALAHELLVNTYGVETYINWNRAIAAELPDFKWYGMSESVRQTGNAGFANLFNQYFGIELGTWESTELAEYVLDVMG